MSHWYKLPVDKNYYRRAACSVTAENARFWDSNDSTATPLHGNAVCTNDCLRPNKNAILQLLTFYPMDTQVRDCGSLLPIDPGQPRPPPITCYQGLSESVQAVTFIGVTFFCSLGEDFTNLQAANWMSRVKIYDIVWGPQSIGLNNNLADSTGLYIPANSPFTSIYGGSLYLQSDPRVIAFRDLYDSSIPAARVLNNMIDTCSIADPGNQDDIDSQNLIIAQCRSIYQSVHGNLVGHNGPISVTPTTEDLQPSMGPACQYVYDISDTSSCPLIDDMCKTQMNGDWRFSLSTMDSASILKNLPNHFCQNFVPATNVFGLSWLQNPFGQPQSADPGNQYYAGFGRQPQLDQLIPSLQPQSWAAYIYRSCTLHSYTADRTNCCANDFADLEGSSEYTPPISQPPIPLPPILPNAHRTALIGYNYDAATPWYQNCFDSTGLTCDVALRDITGTGCGPLMSAHCATNPNDSSPLSWDTTITDGSTECSRWLGRLLYGYGGTWVNFLNIVNARGQLPDLTGTQLSYNILSDILNNYNKVFDMAKIAAGNLTGLAAAMEPVVFTLYKSYDLALHDNSYLINNCSIYTIDDVRNNSLLRKWCGCMLNATSYSTYYPGISTACTPPCNSSDVIQFGQPCLGTLCILDQLTIDLIGTKSGGVSIIQVCQSCGQITGNDTSTIRQTCQCTIQDGKVEAINSAIGTITINEFCTPSNATPNTKPPVTKRIVDATASAAVTFPYTLVSLLVVMGILGLIALVISRGLKKGNSYLWARGLAFALLIIAIIVLAGIVYVITMKTIG